MIAVLWVIIAVGIYQCAVTLNGKDNPKETAQLEKEDKGQNSKEVKLNEKTQTENQAANITETPAQTETLPFDRNIRVLIKTENFDDIFHKEIRLSGTEGLEIRLGSKSRIFSPYSPAAAVAAAKMKTAAAKMKMASAKIVAAETAEYACLM